MSRILKNQARDWFMTRVAVRDTGCWEWTGTINDNGYGVLKIDGRQWRAHRASYAIHNGEVPDDLFICHHCDNRKCVRPDHLYAGTPLQNMQDKVSRGRHHALLRTHCPRGHEYTEENTYRWRTHRNCRACRSGVK